MLCNIPSGLEERPNLGLGDLLLARLGLRDLQKIYNSKNLLFPQDSNQPMNILSMNLPFSPVLMKLDCNNDI